MSFLILNTQAKTIFTQDHAVILHPPKQPSFNSFYYKSKSTLASRSNPASLKNIPLTSLAHSSITRILVHTTYSKTES